VDTTPYQEVPSFLEALQRLAETGHKVRAWSDPALLQGFETDEQRITIPLATLRRYYRMGGLGGIEPYDANLQRYKDDVKRVLQQSMPPHFAEGRQVVTRLVQKTTGRPMHHGRVVEVNGTDITIRHDPDCCEPGVLTTLDVDVAHAEWRQIIVRRSAWDRILGDD
jgi:hypothetical protein